MIEIEVGQISEQWTVHHGCDGCFGDKDRLMKPYNFDKLSSPKRANREI